MRSFRICYDWLASDGEKYLSDSVAKAVQEYIEGYLLEQYEPKQEQFDEAEVRQHIEDIVLDAANWVLDRWLKELRKLHAELWQEQKETAHIEAHNPSSLWDLAADIMLTQGALLGRGSARK